MGDREPNVVNPDTLATALIVESGLAFVKLLDQRLDVVGPVTSDPD